MEIRDTKAEVTASKWCKRIYGTPQWSVLGPLLWNLFFNPLLTELSTSKRHSEPPGAEAGDGGQEEVSCDVARNTGSWTQAPTQRTALGGDAESGQVDSLDTAYADDLTLAAASHDPNKAEALLEEKLLIFKRFLETRVMESAAHKS